MHTTGQMIFDLFYKIGSFLAADRLAFTKFAEQILAGLIDETQNGAQCLFTAVFAIMSFAAALLVAAKDRLHGRIDTDTDFVIIDIAKLPHPLAQDADNI